MTNVPDNSIEKTSKTKMMDIIEDLEKANKRIRDLEKHLKDRDRIIKKFQENSKKGRNHGKANWRRSL